MLKPPIHLTTSQVVETQVCAITIGGPFQSTPNRVDKLLKNMLKSTTICFILKE